MDQWFLVWRFWLSPKIVDLDQFRLLMLSIKNQNQTRKVKIWVPEKRTKIGVDFMCRSVKVIDFLVDFDWSYLVSIKNKHIGFLEVQWWLLGIKWICAYLILESNVLWIWNQIQFHEKRFVKGTVIFRFCIGWMVHDSKYRWLNLVNRV